MEKTREQRRSLYIAFVDFTKACDTVNREQNFIILGRLGCLPKFVRVIKKLHTVVKARVIVDGDLTQYFEYNKARTRNPSAPMNPLNNTARQVRFLRSRKFDSTYHK